MDWSQSVELDDSWAPEAVDWTQPEEEDLMGLPILDPQVRDFLSGEKLKGDSSLWEYPPKSSFDIANDWVVWWAEQVAMPTWWPELVSIPGSRDIHRLAWQIWALFQMLQACYKGIKRFNDYTVLSA